MVLLRQLAAQHLMTHDTITDAFLQLRALKSPMGAPHFRHPGFIGLLASTIDLLPEFSSDQARVIVQTLAALDADFLPAFALAELVKTVLADCPRASPAANLQFLEALVLLKRGSLAVKALSLFLTTRSMSTPSSIASMLELVARLGQPVASAPAFQTADSLLAQAADADKSHTEVRHKAAWIHRPVLGACSGTSLAVCQLSVARRLPQDRKSAQP